MRRALAVIAFIFAALMAQAQPTQMYYIYGLYTDEEATVWGYYLMSDWINYPERGNGIYTAAQPVAYVPVNADGQMESCPVFAGTSADGRRVYR